MSVWKSISAPKGGVVISFAAGLRQRLLPRAASKRTGWHRFATTTQSNPSSNPVSRSNFVYSRRSSFTEVASETAFIMLGWTGPFFIFFSIAAAVTAV
jgi:hypothetical protein